MQSTGEPESGGWDSSHQCPKCGAIAMASIDGFGRVCGECGWPWLVGRPGGRYFGESRRGGERTSLGEPFTRALLLAADLHKDQPRKGTSIPYLSHLLAVTAIVLEAGGGEDVACAALLHDAVEDQGGEVTAQRIERDLGKHVADVVRGCSEISGTPKPPWEFRKRTYLWHLQHEAGPDVLLVALADKVHNLRSILADRRAVGSTVWRRFNASPEDEIRYYGALVNIFRLRSAGALTEQLAETLAELERLEGLPRVAPLEPLNPDAGAAGSAQRQTGAD